MLFKEIVGQQEVIDRLISNTKNDRISHAQLFIGKEGTGSLAIALAYAQYILCTNKQEKDACGECPSCKKNAKFSHPDLHFSFPTIKSLLCKAYLKEWKSYALNNPYLNRADWLSHIEAGNAQGLIYTGEGDEIIKRLSLKAFESEYKVQIIWLAEAMNAECANKLLKIIEEPPVKTVFLLITEAEEQIISTIRSRCQPITIPAIAEEDIREELAQHPNAAEMNISNIAHLSQGNYRYANILMDPASRDVFNHEMFKELMRYAYARKYQEIFEWVESMQKIGREKQKQFATYALGQVRENFIYNMQQEELCYLDDEEKAFSSRFSPFINERNIIPLSQEFERVITDISMNGNAGIILTDLALRIIKLIRR